MFSNRRQVCLSDDKQAKSRVKHTNCSNNYSAHCFGESNFITLQVHPWKGRLDIYTCVYLSLQNKLSLINHGVFCFWGWATPKTSWMNQPISRIFQVFNIKNTMGRNPVCKAVASHCLWCSYHTFQSASFGCFQVVFLGQFAKHYVEICGGVWFIRLVVAAVFTANISVFLFTFFRETKVSDLGFQHSLTIFPIKIDPCM